MTKDWALEVCHSDVCQVLLQVVAKVMTTSSPPAWTSSARMLSTPADFPFFNDWTAASTFLPKMEWLSLGQFSTVIELHWHHTYQRTIHCFHMLLQLKHSSPHFVSDYKSDMDKNQSCKSGLKTGAVLGRFHLQGNRKGQLSEKQGQSSGTILSKKTWKGSV